MIPIYICDDDEKEKKYLHKLIESLILILGYDMQVVLATGMPEEIIKHRRSHAKQSVYFLDVELKNEACNGFALAKQLRKLDPRGFIVFVTIHEEMMYETFRYRLEALDYVIKEELYKLTVRLQECLTEIDRLVCNDNHGHQNYFTVKAGGYVFHIPTEDILYFETSEENHRVTLHAQDRMLEFRGDLITLEKDMGTGFLKVHRSYLVRLDKIRQVNFSDGTLIMMDGSTCLLSRKGKRVLKDYFDAKEVCKV